MTLNIKGKKYSKWVIHTHDDGKAILCVDTLMVSQCNSLEDAINDLVSIETEGDENTRADGWVSVDGYKNIPLGRWQVAELKKDGTVDIHTAVIRENLSIIGGHFAFDRGYIYAYCKCLDAPSPPTT